MRHLLTGPGDAGAGLSSRVGTARTAAEAAAGASGVSVRELRALSELRRACDLIDQTWSPDGQEPLISVSMLRALVHVGNYVAGAFLGNRLVGAAVAFRGDRGGVLELHSHITTVTDDMRGRNVGFALKLHQRYWALRRSLPTITWTFDPLACRNAFFNLVKLGAQPVEYLPNFYGAMADGINAGDDSDRLLVEWRLDEPRVRRACTGALQDWNVDALRAEGAVIGLDADPQGLPLAGESSGRVVLVRVPPDIEWLRREQNVSARAWRRAVREALGGLMTEGAVVGFARSGWYVVDRTDPDARRAVP
ncbi:GNAT family N-acetyltransferase [Micromonospora sp. NPDC050495]|uniref:GNAT family N-acetyltransferase n=1 Tax=Micromonospora sp. NPDC050495 TaxID=3154936 RepID=UPI0033F68FD2